LDLSAVGIAQLAHTVGKSILFHEGWRCSSSLMTLGKTCLYLLLVIWYQDRKTNGNEGLKTVYRIAESY